MKKTALTAAFSEIRKKDVPLVGGKNASLGELFSVLQKKGINVPDGFVVTAHAYDRILGENGIREQVHALADSIDTGNVRDLRKKAQKIRSLISKAMLPEDIREEIAKAYTTLSTKYHTKNVDVAVRSSATAEDLPGASFAGQQETYLNISGIPALEEAILNCMASLYTDRAISYRIDQGFDHRSVKLSVTVQKMVRSDKASAGVLFTLDPESGFDNVCIVNSSYGLGEYVVKGVITPDEFVVFKETLSTKKYNPVIAKRLGTKKKALVYGTKKSTDKRAGTAKEKTE